jgi:EREBP-like factor
MCGGAILSDFIPSAGRSRRVTADYLWPELKRPKKSSKIQNGKALFDEFGSYDDFEADFEDFEQDSVGDFEKELSNDFDEDEFEKILDVKPFSFDSKSTISRGIRLFFLFSFCVIDIVYFVWYCPGT